MSDLDSQAKAIESVITDYMQAVKTGDWQVVQQNCTSKMFGQFKGIVIFSLWLARVFRKKKLQALNPEHLRIDVQDSDRAVAEYSVNYGRRHQYERIALLKVNGQWLIDGKFA